MFKGTGVRLAASQVIATSGAKQALYNACLALLDEGDEAVIPNPYWVSYPEMVRLAGAKPLDLMLRQEDGCRRGRGPRAPADAPDAGVHVLQPIESDRGGLEPEAMRGVSGRWRSSPGWWSSPTTSTIGWSTAA